MNNGIKIIVYAKAMLIANIVWTVNYYILKWVIIRNTVCVTNITEIKNILSLIELNKKLASIEFMNVNITENTAEIMPKPSWLISLSSDE